MKVPSSQRAVGFDGWFDDLHYPLKGPSSSLTDVSLKLFQDLNGETTTAPPSWPVLSGYMPEEALSKLGASTEILKKSESCGGCRLFGVDLVNYSSSTVSVEKATVAPMMEPPVHTIASVEGSDQQSGLSKEQKQGLLASLKEI